MNEKQTNEKSKSSHQARQQQEGKDMSAFWPYPHDSNSSSIEDVGRKKHSSELTSKMSTSPLNGRQHDIGLSEMDYTSTSSYSSHQHQHGSTDGRHLFQYYPTPPAATPSFTNKTVSSFNSNPTSYNPHQRHDHFVKSDSRNSSTGIQQSSRDGTTLRRNYRTNLAQDPQEKHRTDDEYRRFHTNGCPSSSSQVPIAFYPSRGYDYQYQSQNGKNYDYNTVVNRRRNVSPADPNTFNDDYDSNYKQSSRAEEKQVTSVAPSDTPKATNQKQKETKKTTETQKKKKRKKPKDAPKRPLSAYNVFFKEERQRMLQSLPRMDNDPTSNSSSKSSSRRRKGRDRPHGKISFENLAKTIGSRWRELGNAERKKFEILAAKDTERYTEEMKVFHDEQMMKASTISSNDHSHEDSDEKVSSSLMKQRTTNDDYDSSAKNEVEKTKSGAAALEEREIEPVPFDSVFLPPSPFSCEDETNRSWSLKDYSFDSFDPKKAG